MQSFMCHVWISQSKCLKDFDDPSTESPQCWAQIHSSDISWTLVKRCWFSSSVVLFVYVPLTQKKNKNAPPNGALHSFPENVSGREKGHDDEGKGQSQRFHAGKQAWHGSRVTNPINRQGPKQHVDVMRWKKRLRDATTESVKIRRETQIGKIPCERISGSSRLNFCGRKKNVEQIERKKKSHMMVRATK